jgi:ribonuclease Z
MKTKSLILFLIGACALLHAQTPLFHVTLLGTGVPTLDPVAYVNSGRVNAAMLVETGPNLSERLLFDCGQAVLTRLLQSGGADPVHNPNVAVDKVFITHLHSDHYSDLAAIYSYGWLFRYDLPLRIWGPGPGPNGPFGTSMIAAFLRFVYDTDVNIRALGFKDFTFPISGATPIATELREGPVYSSKGVTVSAFLVDHHPVNPSYGFRIDYGGHSVVYSGDTTYNTNLIKNSMNADLLIHEIYAWPRSDGPEVYDYHTSPADWARVMSATSPKMGVMTHIAAPSGMTDTDLANQVKTGGYSGAVKVGTDLMTLDVFASSIVAKPYAAPAVAPVSDPLSALPAEMRARLRRRIVD